MFYHGYDNYMNHAFPEDELRPISCTPLSRDRANPGHIELNDALGNYSLTLIDSLSTLAIMTSTSADNKVKQQNRALLAFQDGVKALVEQYGDGSEGVGATGKRARGFDLDSKVQVFETVIRGVGGLVSAHLFAVGELPMVGYKPKPLKKKKTKEMPSGAIKWPNQFIYDGQLLRLAEGLARRLLPAFVTATGLPYPRVNLRYSVPFYSNSPLNANAETGECPRTPNPSAEITETCSAGAGSLVLEFTTLSRLTGDPVFEQVAKRAFWAVWERRSAIGLVGSGIDAESGYWTTPYTGIGAGIDSFYEYAAKASVLLSNSPIPERLPPITANTTSPAEWMQLVSEFQQTAEAFGEVWLAAHDSIKRHLYRNSQYTHPHYIQGDLFTGAGRAYWIDSLSAFYPGVLATTGELEEAIETHLLATAVWTRYSALPERWSVSSGGIEAGLGWWGGRPEFIESTYYLYQATKDPWYLHVGEMVLRDIKRRCWTKCGWAGIQDVKNGDQSDRMESFFLGETTKYLFLLFTPDHPLNKLDAPFVFSTEGHPLIIPRSARQPGSQSSKSSDLSQDRLSDRTPIDCPVPPAIVPLSISPTAARGDLFHAAKLARLHMMPTRETLESPLIEYSNDHPSITVSDIRSPSNFTFYPWTLPSQYIPNKGISSKIHTRHTFDITFPTVPNTILGPGILQRVGNGILVNSLSGIRFGLIQDVPPAFDSDITDMEHYRIQSVNNILLGRDERVFLAKNTAESVIAPSDPNFTRVRDASILDLVVDLPVDPNVAPNATTVEPAATEVEATTPPPSPDIVIQASTDEPASSVKQAFSMLLQQVGLLLTDPPAPPPVRPDSHTSLREYIPASLPTGPGAAPIPDVQEALPPDVHGKPQGDLRWSTIYIASGNGCTKLPNAAPRDHQIIVMRRGECSFAAKLQNIPTFAPSRRSLQLVIVVSFDSDQAEDGDAQATDATPNVLIRPLLDAPQLTRSGLPRRNPIPMVMIEGGEAMWQLMQRTVKVGFKRRYEMRAQGVPIANLNIL